MTDLTPIHVGDRVFDRITGEPMTITAIGNGSLLAECSGNGETVELAYKFNEVSIHPGYPELVVNVYRPDPFDKGLAPGRLFKSLPISRLDPDWHKVTLQMVLTNTGISYTQMVVHE